MKLKLVQDRIVKALEADEWFRKFAIPVVAEDQGDVSAMLQAALVKARRGVLVQTTGFTASSSASKVMVGEAAVAVQALERIPENRKNGGPSAQDIAEVVAWRLNLLPLDGVGTLVFRKIESDMLDDGRTLSYVATFAVQTTLGNPLD